MSVGGGFEFRHITSPSVLHQPWEESSIIIPLSEDELIAGTERLSKQLKMIQLVSGSAGGRGDPGSKSLLALSP